MGRAEKGGTAKKDRLSAKWLIDGEFCHELGREDFEPKADCEVVGERDFSWS